jgi:hypothetical protein
MDCAITSEANGSDAVGYIPRTSAFSPYNETGLDAALSIAHQQDAPNNTPISAPELAYASDDPTERTTPPLFSIAQQLREKEELFFH